MNGRRRRWNGKVFRANARSVRFLPVCERLEDIQLLSSITVGTDNLYTLYGNPDGTDLSTFTNQLGAGTNTGNKGVYVGLFEFPTSSIPSNVVDSPSSITSATLTFSNVGNYGSAPTAASFNASPVNVIGLSGFNGSTTIQGGDYFNSPGQTVGSFVPTLAKNYQWGAPTGAYTVDVTSFVEQALASNSMPQEIAFRLESPGGNVIMDVDGMGGAPILTITYADYAVITPTNLSWLADGSGGVSVDYTVTGTLPQGSDAEIGLYWSPTSAFDPSTASATGASIPVEQTPDGPTTFTAAQLGTPPPGTQYLLAVADPNHVVTDPKSFPSFDSAPYVGVENPTATSLDASPISGTNVTLTATVTAPSGGSTPTGSVEFKVNGNNLGAASLQDGQAQLTTSLSGATVYIAEADYQGDPPFLPSDSDQLGLQDPLTETRQLLAQAQAQLTSVNAKIAPEESKEQKIEDDYISSAVGLWAKLPGLLSSATNTMRATIDVAEDQGALATDYNDLVGLQSEVYSLSNNLIDLQAGDEYTIGESRNSIESAARSVANQMAADRNEIERIEQDIDKVTAHLQSATGRATRAAINAVTGVLEQSFKAVNKFASLVPRTTPNQTLTNLDDEREELDAEIADLSQRIQSDNPVPSGITTLNQLSKDVTLPIQVDGGGGGGQGANGGSKHVTLPVQIDGAS